MDDDKLQDRIQKLISELATSRGEYAIRSLVEMGDPAIPALIEIIESRAPGFLGALNALGDIGNAKALPVFMNIIAQDKLVRADGVILISAWNKSSVLEAIVKFRTKALPFLFQALEDEDKTVRTYAIEGLSHIRHSSTVSFFIKLIEERDSKERIHAAKALGRLLGKMHDEPALSALIEALDDSNIKVQISAAEALKGIADTRAVAASVRALGSDNTDLQLKASVLIEDIFKRCSTKGKLDHFEAALGQGYRSIRKKNKRIDYIKSRVVRQKTEIAQRRNEIAKDQGILLDDKPKPPKRGKIYRAMRMIRNG